MISNIQVILAIIVSSISITVGFISLIKWLVKHYLAELRPNGGGSMKDQINRLEARLDALYDHLIDK